MSADLSPVDATQREIIAALHVAPVFDAAVELERRTDFLASYLRSTGLKTLVLGCVRKATTPASSRCACPTACRKTKPRRNARSA
jgi:hypothetical protein